MLVGGGLIVLTTATQLGMLREWRQLWTGLPLAAAILGAVTARVPTAVGRAERRRYLPAAWIFLALFTGGLFLRLPEAIRARDFEQLVGRGVAALAAGDLAASRVQLAAALARRPGHADVQRLLGWAELQAGERVAAREHLEAAVAGRPASVEATRYLMLLDLFEERRSEVTALLERRTRFPETADLAYLAWKARAQSSPSRRRRRRQRSRPRAPAEIRRLRVGPGTRRRSDDAGVHPPRARDDRRAAAVPQSFGGRPARAVRAAAINSSDGSSSARMRSSSAAASRYRWDAAR